MRFGAILIFLLFSPALLDGLRAQEMIWRPMGGVGISEGEADYQSIAIDDHGNVWLAYRDIANEGKATVLRWSENRWTVVGEKGISEGSATYVDLAIGLDGSPWLAYRDNEQGGRTTVLNWNGQMWQTVGVRGISDGGSTYQSLAIDEQGRPWVAFRDWANESRTTVLHWDGNAWGAIGGPGISSSMADFQSLAIAPDGAPWVAYKDFDDFGKTTVLRWNEESQAWQAVGGQGVSEGRSRHQSLAFASDGSPWIAYEDYEHGRKATVLRWDFEEEQWLAVGGPGISMDRAWFQSLAFGPDGSAWLAFRDGSDDWPGAEEWNTTVMKWDGANWNDVGGRGISRGTAHHHSLAVDPSGAPWLAYQDNFNFNTSTVISWQERLKDDKEMYEYDLEAPLQVNLHQNYPNPFNPESAITFELPRTEDVTLDIFTSDGRHLVTLLQERLDRGIHEITFRPENLSSGLYIYRLTAGGITRSRAMVYIK